MATFADQIGAGTRDILGGFNYDHKIAVSSVMAGGMKFSGSGAKKGDTVNANVAANYKIMDGVVADCSFSDKGKMNTAVSLSNLAPGFKATVSGSLPDLGSSGKVALQVNKNNIGWKGDISAGDSAKIDTSLCINASGMSFGGNFGYDAGKSTATKYGIGAQYKKDDVTVAAGLADCFGAINISYLRKLNDSTNVCGQIEHKLAGGDGSTTLTIGGKKNLDDGATVKATVNNHGLLSMRYSQDLKKNTTLVFCTQIDTKQLDKSAKMGLQLNIKA